MNNKTNTTRTTHTTHTTAEKIKKFSLIYYILQPILFVISIIVAFCFKGNWYALGIMALGLSYVGFGYNVSNLIDDYIRLLYPQCYSMKGRPNNSKIKRAARAAGDNDTLNMKKQQSVMFAVCAVAIVLVCMIGIMLS